VKLGKSIGGLFMRVAGLVIAIVLSGIGSARAPAQAQDSITAPISAINAPINDITGTVSKAEPSIEQDGTPAHPYADVSQCPTTTDVIFWPRNDRPIPNMPPGLSVCFVGTQSFTNAGSDLTVRGQ
jgi:hypothetical protein